MFLPNCKLEKDKYVGIFTLEYSAPHLSAPHKNTQCDAIASVAERRRVAGEFECLCVVGFLCWAKRSLQVPCDDARLCV